MTSIEAAAYLKIDRRTLNRWVAAGRLVKHYPNGDLEAPRFHADQLNALMVALPPTRRRRTKTVA